jgi:hypothetical protein
VPPVTDPRPRRDFAPGFDAVSPPRGSGWSRLRRRRRTPARAAANGIPLRLQRSAPAPLAQPPAARRPILEGRLPGLRLRWLPGPFTGIEEQPFSRWDWAPPAAPRHRFHSASGLLRVRYAATSLHGAARERYRDTGSLIPADRDRHYVETLTSRVRVLDLRSGSTLDALGVDDRVSTGHEQAGWEAAQQLTDSVLRLWGDAVHGLLYRSRTTPGSSANIPFFARAPLRGQAHFHGRLEPSGAGCARPVIEQMFECRRGDLVQSPPLVRTP